MSERPAFLMVSYGDSGLQTMSYEKRMVRQEEVKFENENGTLELTDVRLVWYKAPDKGSKLKKFGAFAGAIAGAAILEGVGHQIGGLGGRAIRGVARGIGAAAVYSAVSSLTADAFYNKNANGQTESIAVPVVAINNAQQSGNDLIVELKSGGAMKFTFKQPKAIPAIIASVVQAQHVGKCPYCGANAEGASSCPRCGAPIEGGNTGGRPAARGGTGQPESISIHFTTTGGGGGFCTNCGSSLPAGAKFCNNCGARVG